MPTTKADLAVYAAFAAASRRLRRTAGDELAALYLLYEDDPDAFTAAAAVVLAATSGVSVRLVESFLQQLTDPDRRRAGALQVSPQMQNLMVPFEDRRLRIREPRVKDPAAVAARARKSAEAKARALAEEQSIQSQRAAMHQAGMSGNWGITGWRRVPIGVTCNWCMTVSTQRYRTAESASFGHGHKGVDYCDCQVVPIIGDKDVGRVANRPVLRALSSQRRDNGGSAYWNAGTATPAARPKHHDEPED